MIVVVFTIPETDLRPTSHEFKGRDEITYAS